MAIFKRCDWSPVRSGSPLEFPLLRRPLLGRAEAATLFQVTLTVTGQRETSSNILPFLRDG